MIYDSRFMNIYNWIKTKVVSTEKIPNYQDLLYVVEVGKTFDFKRASYISVNISQHQVEITS